MKIPPIYIEPIKQQDSNLQKTIEEEWKSLGEPRITPDLMLDLQALAIQKQQIINNNRLSVE